MVRAVCVRACVRAQEMPITGQSNKIKTKRNLGLRVNSYATLYSSKMRTSVCTSSPHRSVSERAGTRTVVVAPPAPPDTLGEGGMLLSSGASVGFERI